MGYVLCCSVGILHNVVLAFRGESSLGTTAQTYIKEEYDKVSFFCFFWGGYGLRVLGFMGLGLIPGYLATLHCRIPSPFPRRDSRDIRARFNTGALQNYQYHFGGFLSLIIV